MGLPYDSPEHKTLHVAATKACHDRLASQGINLSNFNTAENEADFADLRKALHIKQWNVYGLSYGTDLALSLMRDYPEGIRSVIIDAVLPPAPYRSDGRGPTPMKPLTTSFARCNNQPACAAKYGDLSAHFTSQVQA